MEFEIVIKNYRCFPDTNPARVAVGDGFTAFIGVNNSGKSSLLKFFYEFRSVFHIISNDIQGLDSALKGSQQNFMQQLSVSDSDELFHKDNNRDIKIEVCLKGEVSHTPGALPQVERLMLTVERRTKQWTVEVFGHYVPESRSRVSVLTDGTISNGGVRLASLSLLRDTLRPLAQTLYIGPFRNAINFGANQDYYDIKVGQAFLTDWREQKTGANVSRNEAIIKLTDEIRRIFEFDRLEIDTSSDATNLKVFVNDKSFKLSELGAGLSQFVIVLATAAIRRPSFILIDEPELNLHPSLQMDFLTTLASYATEGLLFATHSIGLARAVANRLYSFRRIAEGQTEVRDFETTPRYAEFVGELSFSGYQELGFDKILLVEGPTDVTTFQQFLRLYRKDHKIVILPLGGSSFITKESTQQLAEVKRICENVSAVIDSERATAGASLGRERAEFEQGCKDIGIQCHVLHRRAIENYFTDAAVKAAKGARFRSLASFEDRAAVKPIWGKRENWRIARKITVEELNATDLGPFLDAL